MNTRSFRGPSASRRPSFSRPGFGGGRRPSYPRRSFKSNGIDPSRFVNKAIITEQAEHFVPEHAFKDFQVDKELKRNIAEKGYITPTPIQDKAIPHVLRGSDVVGIANTGTGKTAAFLIPLLHKVLLNPQENVLVIVPTRELAQQIDQELREFAKYMRIYSVCCVGGANIGRQIADLRRRHNFVIGTPGRLKDLVKRQCINLSKFNTLVLDEADRMLDMGFIVDMRFIMSGMPKQRQTLFFSATVSHEISGLIREFLREPITISVKIQDTPSNVDQDVIRIQPGGSKIDVLHDLLIQADFKKVLIFGRTKHGVEKLSKLLLQRGFKAESIHGNKNQSQRQRALQLFKMNNIQILIATDVAARGLDIADVSHVINFDLPGSYDDYVHRIGRTGRADKKGKALTFIE